MEHAVRDAVIAYIRDTYRVEPESPWVGYPENRTFKERFTQKWFALLMPVSYRALGLPGEGMMDVMNVKSTPEMIGILSSMDGFQAGYHMNKQHWLTVYLDGSVELNQIFQLIDDSYQMLVDTPTVRIYEAVKRIPKGCVATYGQVAELAGDRKMARAVGNALHKNPDPENIPCFRVVNSKGELAGEFAFGGEDAQAVLLRAEGVEVVNHKVDLKRFGICVEELLEQ